MGRYRFMIVTSILLGAFVLAWGDGQVRAQSDPAVEAGPPAIAERLRERAAKTQERRKARVTHAQRKAAAERASKNHDAPSGKTDPGKSGKGGIK